jgi:hypothetical protein
MAIKKWGSSKGFQISVEGFDVTLRTIKLSKDQRRMLEGFVQEECDKVIDHAQEIVPWDTGALHDSHRREKVSANREGIRYRVLAGGVTAKGKFVDYAEKVHSREPWLAEAAAFERIGYEERAIRHLRWITGTKKVRVRA